MITKNKNLIQILLVTFLHYFMTTNCLCWLQNITYYYSRIIFKCCSEFFFRILFKRHCYVIFWIFSELFKYLHKLENTSAKNCILNTLNNKFCPLITVVSTRSNVSEDHYVIFIIHFVLGHYNHPQKDFFAH